MHGHHTAPSAAPATPDERAAMDRALALAARGPADDANPRVGCVLLAADGTTLGEGWHRGTGTPHAEVAAITDARAQENETHGATAVVTLEPCAHTGRTGPCTRALRDAGIARVVYALADPGASSGGGARELASAGVDVVRGPGEEQSRELVAGWYARAARAPEQAPTPERGPVHLVLKTATSLDGKVAAADGTSQWITGEASRAHAHTVRARTDAIIVGTGTVLADDPSLTARPGPAAQPDSAARTQPLRVVVGRRDIPEDATVRGSDGKFLHLRTHEPQEVHAALAARGVGHAVLEGGPGLATAFLRAGLVDEIHAYLAPLHLGESGRSALADLGIATLAAAPRWRTEDVQRLGEDVLLIALRAAPGPAPGS